MATRRKPRAAAHLAEEEVCGTLGFPFASGEPRVTVEEACEAVGRFFAFHDEGLRRQHPELVRAGVDAKARENRYAMLIRWTEARVEGRPGASAEVEEEVRAAARHCRESWHAAILIGCASGRYTVREQGGPGGQIDDYAALTGYWWDTDWKAIVEDIGAYPPARPAGRPRKPGEETARDHLICEAVGALGDVGFYIHRGDDKRDDVRSIRTSAHPCACAIVACVLAENGIEPRLAERTVMQIWGVFKTHWQEGAVNGYARPLFDEFGSDWSGPLSAWGRDRARERIESAKR